MVDDLFDYFMKAFIVGAFIIAISWIVAMIASLGVRDCEAAVSSDEFVRTQAGAPRFQRYETNEDGLEVVVDAETGVAYLVTRNGVEQLVEQGGEPLTIADVGE